jgi:hypothetical protein
LTPEHVAIHTAAVIAVDMAKAEGSILRVGEATKQIRSQHPDCQLAARQIADMVARLAITAGVPIQFTDPN